MFYYLHTYKCGKQTVQKIHTDEAKAQESFTLCGGTLKKLVEVE